MPMSSAKNIDAKIPIIFLCCLSCADVFSLCAINDTNPTRINKIVNNTNGEIYNVMMPGIIVSKKIKQYVTMRSNKIISTRVL